MSSDTDWIIKQIKLIYQIQLFSIKTTKHAKIYDKTETWQLQQFYGCP